MITKQTNITIVGKPEVTSYILAQNILGEIHTLENLHDLHASKILILSDKTAFELYGRKLIDSLRNLDLPIVPTIVLPGERQKTLRQLEKAIMPFFQSGFDKQAVLVCLGGGVICDVGGLIGSLLLRGIKTVYIPTTLLAQIDAAVGGKTGVDLNMPNGNVFKNMLGTTRQPSIVVTDISVLKTLPKIEIQNALGELYKYYLGWGNPSFDQISDFKNGKLNNEKIIELINTCQTIKIDIIQKDTLDTLHVRELLNLGHTLGHGIESASHFQLPHGVCVALGLTAIVKISKLVGLIDTKIENEVIDNLKQLELQTTVTGLKRVDVFKAMKVDKKGGKFVLVKAIGSLKTGCEVNRAIIDSVLNEILI